MTQAQQPEALEDFKLRKMAALGPVHASSGLVERRPAEYRRELEDQFVRGFRAAESLQRARIKELEAQLYAIGAGGVEPLRKCLHQIAEPGCTRSHPHEAMSPECRIRAVIAEMRNREARGAEATEHCLGRFADVLERALADRAMQAQAAPAYQIALDIRTAQGWKLGGDKVPVLYTDTINGQQVMRDDVWLCTTEAIASASQAAPTCDTPRYCQSVQRCTAQDERRAAPAAVAGPDDPMVGAILGAAYDFRDAHLSGSMNQKRSAHAELESTIRTALAAAPAAQAALLEALKEAQAGLEFAAARLPHTTGFVPSHIAALNIVNAALAAAPSTQAAQPAYPELPDFDAVEQHIYAGCRRFIDRDMLEPIHSLIREAVDADRASRGQAPAETAADILERIAEEPPINGNSFATARILMAAQALRDQSPTTQAAPVTQGDADDAARWRWLSEHIAVAWNEGKFTSLVRIVSEKNRADLNASVDRMMAGDWSDADAARAQAKEGQSHD